MTPLYLSRKLCPKCGKPMTAVPDDVVAGPTALRLRGLRRRSAARSRRPEMGGKSAAAPGQVTFEQKSSPAAGSLLTSIVLTTRTNVVALQPHAELRSVARAGGILPDSAAGTSTDASICFTLRRACRSHGCGGPGLHPHGENVGSLVIDLAMATSTGTPMLLTATGPFVRDDAALRWPAEVNYVSLRRPLR
ncbi:hypothetical protein [Bradyrhizobium sp. DOA9]|uniref:hypothetical protein n=1 Tax=Bradyrhizobium sp. DOA9 TaxID=1126627 RepID=UPI001FCD30F2|nr:hypothetical protein [Bradyrhizobium sp. DOA9]